MTDRNDAEALATAKGLTGALEAMTGQLSALAAYGKKNRRLIAGLAVSLALDLILTVFVAVTAIQAHDANNSANAAKAVARVAQQNSRALCLSSNVARAQQIDLWTYVINVSPRPKTAEAKARTVAFEQHLAEVFAPRDCSHVSPGNPGTVPSAPAK